MDNTIRGIRSSIGTIKSVIYVNKKITIFYWHKSYTNEKLFTWQYVCIKSRSKKYCSLFGRL